MDVKAALQKIEELNYELIEATTSKEIASINNEILGLINELELSTGKTIEEIESEYAGA